MANTINGTVNDDQLEGTSERDIIYGDLGNDVINGNDGNDALFGNDGDDTLNGGLGADSLRGGSGNDTLNGEDDDDEIFGGAGNDIIAGGAGNDTIKGHDGADSIVGDAGDDVIDAGAGDDTVNGGDGNDTILGSTGADVLDGGLGDDSIQGGGGNDQIDGGAGNDTLVGDAGNDTITGGDGVDTINAGSGDDTIHGNDGSDIIDGGKGHDTIFGEAGDDEIKGDSGNDTISGGDGDDTIYANAGQDVVNGDAGNDFIAGGGGVDELYGGVGNDKLYGGSGNDRVDGGSGNDRVIGDTGDDTLIGGSGDDVVKGGRDNDTAIYVVADNVGATDVYDGGKETDTLRLEMTAAEFAAAQQDLLDYQAFLAANSDPATDAGASFTFNSFGLTVTDFENLEVYVDGVLTPVNGNTAPGAVDDSGAGGENDVVTGNVLANDTDADGDALTVVAFDATSALGATVNVTPDGSYTYTPGTVHDGLAAGETVTDTFNYTVADPDGATDTAVVSITVTGENDPAVISGDFADDVVEDTVLQATGVISYTDVDGPAGDLTASAPTYGVFVLDPANNSWTYTLDNASADVQGLADGETLQDTITVTAPDGTTQDIVITITGKADGVEIAGDLAGATEEDGQLTAAGTLAITDPDGALGTLTASAASYGTFTLNGLDWEYTLDNANADVQALPAGATLTDTITITGEDGTTQDVVITITGANDVPVITGDTSGTAVEDSGVPATGTAVATDVDTGESGFQPATVAGQYGTLTIAADGTWSYVVDDTNPDVDALLPSSTPLEDVITVQTVDGTEVPLTIQITGNDDPLALQGAEGTIIEGGPMITGQVTATDPDGSENFVAGAYTGTGNLGTLTLLDSGIWFYELNANVDLPAGVTVDDVVTVPSEQGPTTTITIHVQGSNDGPQINLADSIVTGTMTEDVDVQPPGQSLVAAGDIEYSDPDSTSITVTSQFNGSGTPKGTFVAVDDAANSVVNWTYFIPNADVQYLDVNETLTESFTVTLDDGNGGLTSQVVTLTIQGAEDEPIIIDEVANVDYVADVWSPTSVDDPATQNIVEQNDVPNQNPIVLSLDGTDEGQAYDPDDPIVVTDLTITATTVGTINNGQLDGITLVGNDIHVDYDKFKGLDDGETGEVTFTYTVERSDGTTTTAAGNTIVIHGQGDASLITGDDTGSVTEAANAVPNPATTAEGDLTVDDPDGDNTFTGETLQGTYGSLTITAAGHWTYTLDDSLAATDALNDGRDGEERFTVTSADGTEHEIVIDVVGVNDNADPIAGVATPPQTDGEVWEEADADQNETSVATGQLTVTDPDDPNTFQSQTNVAGTYGTFSIDQNGNWTYVVDDAKLDAEGVDDDPATVTDTFAVKSIDGTQTANVVVSIHGKDDAPVVTLTDSTLEVAEGDKNPPYSASSPVEEIDLDDLVSVTDVDSATTFNIWNISVSPANQGVTFDEATNVVTVDRASFDHLSDGDAQTFTIDFTVATADGTNENKTVTLTVTGTNDGPVVQAGSDVSGLVTEDDASVSLVDDGTITYADSELDSVVTATTEWVGGQDNLGNVLTAPLGSMIASTPNNANTATWLFDVENALTQYLTDAAHDEGGTVPTSVTQTWNVIVTDSNGATTTTPVVITIDGVNDEPVFSVNGVEVPAGDPVTGTLGDNTDEISGSVTATDVDNTDGFLAGYAGRTPDNTDDPQDNSLVQDPDQNVASTSQIDGDGNAVAGGPFGKLTIDENGNWTYDLDNDDPRVEALSGTDTLVDIFTVKSVDGTPKQIAITITNDNEAAEISGTVTGSVVEAPGFGSGTASGVLTATDADNADDTFQAGPDNGLYTGQYGTIAMSNDGTGTNNKWTYTLDNSNATVDALNNGESLTDTITVLSEDGTPQVITITINGANDEADIDGQLTGAVVENSNESVSGTATATDVDNPDNKFIAASTSSSDATDSAGNPAYGTFAIDADGNWTFTLDQRADVLDAGETATATYQIQSIDGTTANVNIQITGANDLGTFTGDKSKTIDEEAPNAVGVNQITGDLDYTDPDGAAVTFVPITPAAGTNNGTYGAFSINANGEWTYTLDDNDEGPGTAVDALNDGESLVETFTVETTDGASQVVTITIDGKTDATATTGTVTENDLAETAVGTNVDLVVNAVGYPGQYGVLKVDANGNMTYDINENLVGANPGDPDYETDINQMTTGESIQDVITVPLKSGGTQDITITITGVNDAPIVTPADDPIQDAVTEDLAADMVGNNLLAFGDLGLSDVEGDAVSVQSIVFKEGTQTVGGVTSSIGETGSLTTASITGGVRWVFSAVNDAPAIDALNDGDAIVQTWTITFVDANGATSTKDVEITINGADDGPVVTGDIVEQIDEDGTSVSGNVNAQDVDNSAGFVAETQSSDYGTMVMQANGDWTFTLNPVNQTVADQVQALNVGDKITDTFTFQTAGGTDQNIVIEIEGSDDAPTSVTAANTTVSEDADPATIDLAGLVTVDDIDNNSFSVAVVSQSNGAGKPAMSVNGSEVSFDPADFDYLNTGESVDYTFTIAVTSGSVTTNKAVTVTIEGTNDGPVVRTADSDLTASIEEQSAGVTTVTVGKIYVDDPENDSGVTYNSSAAYTTDPNAPAQVGNLLTAVKSDAGGTYVETKLVLDHADVDYLDAGETLTQTWDVSITEVGGETTVQQVVYTITGTEDTAVINVGAGNASSGDDTSGALGAITEGAAGDTISDDLGSVTDADGAKADGSGTWEAFQPIVANDAAGQGTYGRFQIDEDGNWSYTKDESLAAFNDLIGGETAQETFTVYSADGTASQDVVITVTGTDEDQTGTAGNDELTGGAGPDAINGLAGDDIIDGAAGDDDLTGGAGNDQLTGGAGADKFIFADGDASGVGDVITDFTNGDDLIDLTAVNLANGFADVTVTDSGADAIITYNDGAADQTITLENVDHALIDANDFLF